MDEITSKVREDIGKKSEKSGKERKGKVKSVFHSLGVPHYIYYIYSYILVYYTSLQYRNSLRLSKANIN